MQRRTFIISIAAVSLVAVTATASARPSHRLGDQVPFTEKAWRALPMGAIVLVIGKHGRQWILIHRRGEETVGTYRLPWGGAHAAAMPWRDIERGFSAEVVALGINDDDDDVAAAISHLWTDNERGWHASVQRLRVEARARLRPTMSKTPGNRLDDAVFKRLFG